MKDKAARYAANRRKLLRLSTRDKFENISTIQHEKALRDTYTKAQARHYKQMCNIKRTRHK